MSKHIEGIKFEVIGDAYYIEFKYWYDSANESRTTVLRVDSGDGLMATAQNVKRFSDDLIDRSK